MAVALPGLQSGEEGDADLFKENNKTFDAGQGRVEMEVNKVNADESEIGGVFVASQLGETDMGSKVAKASARDEEKDATTVTLHPRTERTDAKSCAMRPATRNVRAKFDVGDEGHLRTTATICLFELAP